MYFTFASDRKLLFIITAGGRNKLVQFGDPNSNGVSTFTTEDPKVAHAIRKNSLSRRGIIRETSDNPGEEMEAEKKKVTVAKPVETVARRQQTGKPAEQETAEAAAPKESEERTYDNYTIARETICKEFGINKSAVRNPTALAQIAQEHGIIIKYKEI